MTSAQQHRPLSRGSVCPSPRRATSTVCVLSLPGAAPGRAADAGCAEEPLGALAAAFGELRAAVADPSRADGEDLAEGRAVRGGGGGCWASLRPELGSGQAQRWRLSLGPLQTPPGTTALLPDVRQARRCGGSGLAFQGGGSFRGD